MADRADAEQEFNATIGAVVRVLLGRGASVDLSFIQEHIWHAAMLGQIKIHNNHLDEPVGFATWAYFSDEVSEQATQSLTLAIHRSDWNEGINLWLVHFCAIKGYAAEFARHLRSSRRFAAHDRVRFLRHRHNRASSVVDLPLGVNQLRAGRS